MKHVGAPNRLNRDALHDACRRLAKDMLWDNGLPIEESRIETLAFAYFRDIENIDFEYFLVGQGRDPNLLVDVVNYLDHISIPMGENPDWFLTSVQIIIELACPNVSGTRDSETLYRAIERGIRQARKDFDE